MGVLAMAGPGWAGPSAPGDVGQLRDWLDKRNQERKALGLPGANLPKARAAQAWPPKAAKPAASTPAAPPPLAQTGRGPDGRIHHRLMLNEQGPDQLQVYTPSGYAPLSPDDAARLSRMTERGKRAWMAGSSLRDPAAYQSYQKATQDGGRKGR